MYYLPGGLWQPLPAVSRGDPIGLWPLVAAWSCRRNEALSWKKKGHVEGWVPGWSLGVGGDSQQGQAAIAHQVQHPGQAGDWVHMTPARC